MELLSSNEFDIMALLWAEGRPLSKSEIVSSVKRDWKASSVHSLLNKLIEREAIEVAGFVQTGKTIGRTYAPSFSEEEYLAFLICFQQRKKPLCFTRLFNALLESDAIDSSTVCELEEIVKELKNVKPTDKLSLS